MTNEEALEILDTIPTIGEQVDALEMAITALEQKPCEDCKDCISRDRRISRAEVIKLKKEYDKLKQLCEDCIKIPKGATNGEIIQALFPNIDNNFSNVIDLRLWWGRPYKAESEDK